MFYLVKQTPYVNFFSNLEFFIPSTFIQNCKKQIGMFFKILKFYFLFKIYLLLLLDESSIFYIYISLNHILA